MEFLVHNISHSDLVVELSWLHPQPPAAHAPSRVLARPKFSLFQPISQQIMAQIQALHEADEATHAAAPMTQVEKTQAGSSPELRAVRQAGLQPSLLDISSDQPDGHRRARWKVRCNDTECPIGFNLQDAPIEIEHLDQFQLRGESETMKQIESHWDRVAITAVYFPLVAVLLPKWEHVLEEFKSQGSKQIVYLISGAGIPRNAQHAVNGNSTEVTAQLISLFVRQYYPRMEVVQVHSGSNIFRFDDNVQFMVRELRPRLEARREKIVDKCGDAWKAHFHVTIAYADGPPARLSALNASLRMYTPSYLHIWQLKTFWHERKLSMADVDFHSFENIEASPCVPVAKADALTQTLVKEMRIFRDQFLAAEGEGEVASFWLRKSRKPVLAVLLVEKTDARTGAKSIVVHRGVNCEVSMPTGSLCAERNAIGSALASDPTLQRHALKMIGVLGLNLGGGASVSTSTSMSATAVVGGEQDSSLVVDLPLIPLHSPSKSSITVNDAPGVEEEAGCDGTQGCGSSTAASAEKHNPTREEAPNDERHAGEDGAEKSESPRRSSKRRNTNYTSPRKPKRPRTFSVDESSVESLLRESSTPADRNPLAPCGACKEWLVKIAEANPAFRVVTFENSRCRGVYISQLM